MKGVLNSRDYRDFESCILLYLAVLNPNFFSVNKEQKQNSIIQDFANPFDTGGTTGKIQQIMNWTLKSP